jgi:hypothetical protein
VGNEKLSREWTPEEVRAAAPAADESLPEAPTTHRRGMTADRAAGESDHRAGEEDYPEGSQLSERPAIADPPRQFQQAEGT